MSAKRERVLHRGGRVDKVRDGRGEGGGLKKRATGRNHVKSSAMLVYEWTTHINSHSRSPL